MSAFEAVDAHDAAFDWLENGNHETEDSMSIGARERDGDTVVGDQIGFGIAAAARRSSYSPSGKFL